jgi:t-SNARE complex subunit (syntaxin)
MHIAYLLSLYNRNKKFSPLEATKIEAWQSQIRQKILDTSEFTKNSVQKVGEAAYSVRDGRDERIIAVHGIIYVNALLVRLALLCITVGAAVWSSKQTGS